MIDVNTTAAMRYYQSVFNLRLKQKPAADIIFYQTLSDEKWELTLPSLRVYGNRDEFLTIQAAANLSSLDEPLLEQILILPTADLMLKLKRKAGFESIHALRQNFCPIWQD